MIDSDFAEFKDWVSDATEKGRDGIHAQALLNFLSGLELEASSDASLTVRLRRLVAAAVDDAHRQREDAG